jgi:type IV secretory pathway VirB10-like protein
MDKLEKQVNEAEAEKFLEKVLTKRNFFGLLGVIALAYIWFTTRFQHPYLPQGPAPQSFIVPAPVTPKAPETPKPVIVDPPVVPQTPPSTTQAQSTTTTPVQDPMQALIQARIQREHDSAFASMLVPEEKTSTPEIKQEQQPAVQQPTQSPSETKSPAKYIISRGTNASLALDSRIEGEHAGPLDAHFVRDLYLRGTRTLVIPKGSRVIGETTSVGAMNQRRIAASFSVIQRDPVNRACDINLLSPALDEAGSSGLIGDVNTHLASAILGTSLAALLQGVSTGLYRGGSGPSVIIGQTTNGASQATARLLDQFIKLPTITVHEGGLADFPFTKDTPVSLCGGAA